MEFNWQVNNYDYRNRSGNLTSEAQGKVKSKKYFPTFSVDGKLRLVNFNCTEDLRTEWEEVGDFIINSLSLYFFIMALVKPQ